MSKLRIKDLGTVITQEQEQKWNHTFEKRANYISNGIYYISGLYSTDTRELFLMYVAQQEGIEFETE